MEQADFLCLRTKQKQKKKTNDTQLDQMNLKQFRTKQNEDLSSFQETKFEPKDLTTNI